MSARGRIVAVAVSAALLLGGCATGSGDFKDAVAESLESATAYVVVKVSTETTGLFWGVENIVVSVEFPEPPTDDEMVGLFRDIVSPFPDGSDDRLTIRVTVASDPNYSLDDHVGDWFAPTPVHATSLTTEVSRLREVIEKR